MHAVSRLSGRGPTGVDVASVHLYLHVNQKSDYDMMIWYAELDQIAPKGAVWSGSALFAIPLSI